jgi:hypothetical protein
MRGRSLLRQITGVDIGFDALAWHARLTETDEGGYTFEDGHLRFDSLIPEVCAKKEWIDVRDNIPIPIVPDSAPEPRFTWGDHVRVIPTGENTEYIGRISDRAWHHKGEYWYYSIEATKGETTKRYLDGDLEMLTRKEANKSMQTDASPAP